MSDNPIYSLGLNSRRNHTSKARFRVYEIFVDKYFAQYNCKVKSFPKKIELPIFVLKYYHSNSFNGLMGCKIYTMIPHKHFLFNYKLTLSQLFLSSQFGWVSQGKSFMDEFSLLLLYIS